MHNVLSSYQNDVHSDISVDFTKSNGADREVRDSPYIKFFIAYLAKQQHFLCQTLSRHWKSKHMANNHKFIAHFLRINKQKQQMKIARDMDKMAPRMYTLAIFTEIYRLITLNFKYKMQEYASYIDLYSFMQEK